jgi:hypothetical protein
MAPEAIVERWEVAYRQYSDASRTAVSVGPGNREAARAMADASRQVAVAWREIESTPDLPWWVLAAQAFDIQARDWSARADQVWPEDGGGRPRVQLTTRARPRSRHVLRGEAGGSCD